MASAYKGIRLGIGHWALGIGHWAGARRAAGRRSDVRYRAPHLLDALGFNAPSQRALQPRCLTPRQQLPAGLRRHQRPPRRVRHQYPKVAVPMLARRRYQRRYPI